MTEEIKKLPRRIKEVKVKVAGSPPDVDSDFHTVGREDLINYVIDKYGSDNVANIITFGTFKAKLSFKSISKIYDIPATVANRITQTLPEPIDGNEVGLDEIYDELSPRYSEGEDFRQAVESPELRKIVNYAIPLSGRVRNTGVHACGIVISNKPLSETIPTQVRQGDGATVTQWTYPQCESLGLIKMDFLGLDTLDIIDGALKNIELSGKEVPDMKAITDGDMDDEKTLELLKRGETIGVFQLGGQGVRDLLIRVQPDKFLDIAATTALYRPGPMKMNAHNQYADRKNGREDITYIHDDFSGTAVEEILSETYGLIVYQEQCMKIASEYAGMSPYESDLLRKAIGKKKMKLMMELKPKFISGCLEAGASEGAAEQLWKTIEVFGEYGFNKSHSISYAINAYETAYLKTHYPAEFMASIIQQNVRVVDKLPMLLQEATRMGLKIGPVDMNTSQVSMSAPQDSEFDIVYGIKGIKQVNDEIANAIVLERNEGGKYTSIQDFLRRVNKRVTLNAGAIRSLAYAGAFDCFNVSRRAIVEKVKDLMDITKTVKKQSVSMFDLVGDNSGDLISTIDLSAPEYNYNRLIKEEADSIGMFISGHPVDNIGVLAKKFNPVTIHDILENEYSTPRNVFCSITEIHSTTNRSGNRSIKVNLNDPTDSIELYLSKSIIQQLMKGEEIARIEKLKEKGKPFEIGEKSKKPDEMIEIYYNEKIVPITPLETNDLYRVKLKKSQSGRVSISELEQVKTAYDGSIPFLIRIHDNVANEVGAKLMELFAKYPGEMYVHSIFDNDRVVPIKKTVNITRDFIIELEGIVGVDNVLTKEI